ncbi:MAG: hypothetical protein RL154_1488 [Pseudomonadota bacterium]|jgi:PAS domain S-box-containing protein
MLSLIKEFNIYKKKSNMPKYKSAKLNVLVIDDSKMINNFLVDILTKLVCSCTSAYTYEEAQLAILKEDFDLIFLDLHLPDGEGEELFLTIKANCSAKIVVFTSDKDLFKRDFFFQNGALDYLVKDTPSHIIEEDIKRLLQNLVSNRNISILTVDDSLLVRRALQMLIAPRNYKFLGAKNAKEGFESASKNRPDIIILDLELPDSHGFDFIKRLRSNRGFQKTKIIVLSSSTDPSIVSAAYKMGCVDFLSKPFVSEEVIHKIDSWANIIRESEKNALNKTLLRQYRDAIDSSVIVSKSDINGRITYVNDAFCDISGYTNEELLGNQHNIIRHPEMSKTIFEELWHTIKSGKKWGGIIKNLAKDGSSYWVKTTIFPFTNSSGEVTEFLAIRDDISITMEIKESLQKKLNSTAEDLSEIFSLAQDYELAINESTILSRTDLNGNIIYANKAFYELTGFSPVEVIGKTHVIVHGNETQDEQIKSVWDAISSGKTYKGMFKNRTKDGKNLWLDTTIVPIKNSDGTPREYLAIRHDVSALIELQNEFEETQREILYRLGEIGETRNKETGHHVKRVAEYSRLLGELCGLPELEIELLYMASPMHDIGKVAIPDNVLLKPGKLDQ